MTNNTFQVVTHETPQWLSQFISTYQSLTKHNLGLLENIYHQEVTFIDPMHEVKGIHALLNYFSQLYQDLFSCEFVIENVIMNNDEASIHWTMTYQHNKLNKGETVSIQGCSHIKEKDGKVIYHRDYLDLGAMLYEQIPFFGKIVKWLKSKAVK